MKSIKPYMCIIVHRNTDDVYHVVCYMYTMFIVGNKITSRHALNNESKVILLFGALCSRSRRKYQYSFRISYIFIILQQDTR